MTAESTANNYYTFTSQNGDVAPWSSTHASYRAPRNTKKRAGAGTVGGVDSVNAAGATGAAVSADEAAGRAAAASSGRSEPEYVQAHIIEESDTPFGHKTTWANTGNNPGAGFRTSWTSSPKDSSSAKTAGSEAAASNAVTNRLVGAVQTVAGVGLMAVGVPLLVLPGPGMAAIAGGAVLAGSGVRKIIAGR